MNELILASFSDELIKLAGGDKEHEILGKQKVRAAGASKNSYFGREMGARAGKADRGLRHPHLPWNDSRHAFSSMSKGQHLDTAEQAQRKAGRELARAADQKSVTGLNLRKQYRISKGTRIAREGGHGLDDIGFHHEKPVEEGYAATRSRKAVKGKGYGGGMPAGREHVRSMPAQTGLRGKIQKLKEKVRPTQHSGKYIDEIGDTVADAATHRRSGEYGRGLRHHLEKNLKKRGHSSGQATASAQRVLDTKHVGLLPRAAARARVDASLVAHETSRAVKTAPKLLRSGVRGLMKAPGRAATLLRHV